MSLPWDRFGPEEPPTVSPPSQPPAPASPVAAPAAPTLPTIPVKPPPPPPRPIPAFPDWVKGATDRQLLEHVALQFDPTRQTKGTPMMATTPSPSPSLKQRIAGAWKAIIAFIGAVLTLLTQIGPFAHFLPPQYKALIGTATAVLTGILTFMKANEHWVDDTAPPPPARPASR